MPPRVKARAYDSPARREQAKATRARILAVAEKLFLTRGYRRTTCAAIAGEAGVSEAAVFAVFGSKPRLLVAVVRAAVGGSAAEVPLRERPEWRRLQAEQDRGEAVALFATLVGKAHRRSWRLLSIVRAAAEDDEELASIAAQAGQARRRDCEWFATTVLDLDPTAPETSQRIDAAWAQSSADLYRLLVVERHWPLRRYQAWLSTALERELLEP